MGWLAARRTHDFVLLERALPVPQAGYVVQKACLGATKGNALGVPSHQGGLAGQPARARALPACSRAARGMGTNNSWVRLIEVPTRGRCAPPRNVVNNSNLPSGFHMLHGASLASWTARPAGPPARTLSVSLSLPHSGAYTPLTTPPLTIQLQGRRGLVQKQDSHFQK